MAQKLTTGGEGDNTINKDDIKLNLTDAICIVHDSNQKKVKSNFLSCNVMFCHWKLNQERELDDGNH